MEITLNEVKLYLTKNKITTNSLMEHYGITSKELVDRVNKQISTGVGAFKTRMDYDAACYKLDTDDGMEKKAQKKLQNAVNRQVLYDSIIAAFDSGELVSEDEEINQEQVEEVSEEVVEEAAQEVEKPKRKRKSKKDKRENDEEVDKPKKRKRKSKKSIEEIEKQE